MRCSNLPRPERALAGRGRVARAGQSRRTDNKRPNSTGLTRPGLRSNHTALQAIQPTRRARQCARLMTFYLKFTKRVSGNSGNPPPHTQILNFWRLLKAEFRNGRSLSAAPSSRCVTPQRGGLPPILKYSILLTTLLRNGQLRHFPPLLPSLHTPASPISRYILAGGDRTR